MYSMAGLILGLHEANERCCYKVTPSLMGWAQTKNQPWYRAHTWRLRDLLYTGNEFVQKLQIQKQYIEFFNCRSVHGKISSQVLYHNFISGLIYNLHSIQVQNHAKSHYQMSVLLINIKYFSDHGLSMQQFDIPLIN